jgi:hypothetical protein
MNSGRYGDIEDASWPVLEPEDESPDVVAVRGRVSGEAEARAQAAADVAQWSCQLELHVLPLLRCLRCGRMSHGWQ